MPPPSTALADQARRTCAVVVTYNRAALLAQCLQSLQAQTAAPDHVLVIDNASTDETPDVLAGFPGVEVVRLARNAGSAGGFAEGIARAAGQGWDWLWVMDDDVAPYPDALERLLAHAAPGVAALGSLKVGASGAVQALHLAHYSVRWARKRGLDAQPGDPPQDVSFLSFVGLLVPGHVARLETPPADFFIDQDDTAYSLQLARHGRLVAVPESVIVHYNEQASQTRRVLGRTVVVGGSWRVYYAVRNPLLIARRHGTHLDRLCCALAGGVRLLGRLGAALVHHGGDLRRWRLAARGYADGLRGRSGAVVQPRDYR